VNDSSGIQWRLVETAIYRVSDARQEKYHLIFSPPHIFRYNSSISALKILAIAKAISAFFASIDIRADSTTVTE